MSISTLESAQSQRMLADMDGWTARQVAAERQVGQEIKQAWHLIGVVPAERIALPAVDNAKNKEAAVTLRAAVLELIQEGHCDDALMAVIEHGSCALADTLREQLRDKYIERTAGDVAEYRA